MNTPQRILSIIRLNQIDLFDGVDHGMVVENRPLIQVVDQINRRFPKAVAVAATAIDRHRQVSWRSKAGRVSPRYTTDWQELVPVKC
jgi:DNA polymerase V